MSTTPLTRRGFLATLGAVAAAPLIARAATPKPDYHIGIDPALPGPDTTDHYVVTVQGLAIKVPSNRVAMAFATQGVGVTSEWHEYEGPWDGTFKLERGCTNPAFILADLYERTGVEPDWVVADKRVPASVAGGSMVMSGVTQLLKPRLNWQMLYDWGRASDEVAPSGADIRQNDCPEVWFRSNSPRLTVNTICRTPEDVIRLRETLRMHCLRWQSTDLRYRTSYPVHVAL